ncbi:MAG: hypothetical protein PHG05_00455 [Candidatus Nanoarchaeia archaeon]|nr:hypothetical protein [Candidatus Nanoarchaeia archaeon]
MPDGIKPSTKIWISNLLNGIYVKQTGEFEPNYVQVKNETIFKIGLIATVINKFQSGDNNYVSLTIDDNSGIIRIKGWNEDAKKIIEFEVGDTLNIIAKPREYNQELYLIPAIVKKVDDPNLELMYKAEIFKKYGKPEITKTKEIPQIDEVKEEKITNTGSDFSRMEIINLIEKKSTEEGVRIDDIIISSSLPEQETEKIIEELLKEGEIFQPKPTFIKLIE